MDNIWGADLADIQIINRYTLRIFFFYVIDIFSNYAHAFPFSAF